MSDFPATATQQAGQLVFNSAGLSTPTGQLLVGTRTPTAGASAWPAANRALYLPFSLEVPATAYKMTFIVGAQAGNYDVGIYTETGALVVSLGSTAVPAAGVATANIADTYLTPGTYFMAMNCSTVTTLTVQAATSILTALYLQSVGVQQQAVGATALPSPATFANPASVFFPCLSVHLTAN